MKRILIILAATLCATAALAQSPPPAGIAVGSALPVPRCMVDQFAGNFHTATSADGATSAALIWCDDQKGLAWWGISGNVQAAMGNLSCFAAAGPPGWSLTWLQAAWTACVVKVPTDAELAMLTAIAAQWMPRVTVQIGANRNVYTAKADGTKGPQLVVGGFGMQIAPGLPCWGPARLLNAGARYHGVENQLSTNGVTLPAGSFAQCQIAYPPAAGWPST